MFGIDTIIILAITAALSYAVQLLLAQDAPTVDPLEDKSANVAGKRGTLAPLLLGYNKVTPVVAYVGNRRTWGKIVGTVPDPDGFWEEDDNIYQTAYRESAMHILCIGPARSLYRILEGGKIIFDSEITPATYPSGSELTCTDDDNSTFKIYWGEQNQAIDTDLAALTGVSTRYPYCCYIHWTKKELGGAARWKKLEYIMDCATLGEESDFLDIGADTDTMNMTWNAHSGLFWTTFPRFTTTDTDAADIKVGDTISITTPATIFSVSDIYESGGTYSIFPDTNLPDLVPTTVYSCSISSLGTASKGVNPALAIRQMLFYDFPHGLALQTSLFDTASLDALIPYFEDGGTEPAPATVYLKGGQSYQGAIGALMQDYGIIMYPEADTGEYTFGLIREGTTPTALTNDYVDMSKAEETKAYSVLEPQKVIYSFLEAARNFTTSTILIDDDGHASLSGNPNAKKVALNTPTDIVNASAIASRREQEVSVDRAIKVPVSVDKEGMDIGDTVTFEDLNGTWRLASKGVAIDEAWVEMSFVLDAYSVTNDYVQGGTSGVQTNLAAFPDLYVAVFEGNRYLDPDVHGYYVVRARAHQDINGAWLYRSETDVTADFRSGSKQLTHQALGELNDAIAADTGTLDSIEISADARTGSDFLDFWNITLSDADWRAGTILALVGDELMSVKSITKINDTTVDLEDVLRGRFGTAQGAHSATDEITFFYKATRPFVSDTVIADGDTVYLRTRPFTNTSLLDLDESDSVSLTYGGGGYRPLAPENLNTTNDAYAYESGASAFLRWDYKNASSTTGAGFSLSDETAELSLPEGYFKVTILQGSTIKREETVLVDNFEYTQAMMTTDFGAEPSTFNVEVVEILNGLTSDADTATITKV